MNNKGIRTPAKIPNPSIGESRMFLTIGDGVGLRVGDTAIYISKIKTTGAEGGKKNIEIAIIGPKQTRVSRINF